MIFVKLWKYFIRPRRGLSHIPRQYISEYDIRNATDEELRLMRAGVARSPREARRLLEYYGVSRAVDCLKLLPPREKPLWEKIKRRAIWLVMRIEGAQYKIKFDRGRDNQVPLGRYRDE
jgi:hypothetical protein